VMNKNFRTAFKKIIVCKRNWLLVVGHNSW
jgi:hypothetical protein